jgi:hypothetical protein
MQFGDALLVGLMALSGGALFFVLFFGRTRGPRTQSRGEALNEQYEREIRRQKRRRRRDG